MPVKSLRIFLVSTSRCEDICIVTTNKQHQQKEEEEEKKKKKKCRRLSSCDMKSRDGRTANRHRRVRKRFKRSEVALKLAVKNQIDAHQEIGCKRILPSKTMLAHLHHQVCKI